MLEVRTLTCDTKRDLRRVSRIIAFDAVVNAGVVRRDTHHVQRGADLIETIS